MEDNYKVVEQFVGKIQPREQFERIRNFTRGFLNDNRKWFEQRQREGKVRDCHGDLHLNNICLYQGEIQVFDCIEFSARYRNIDVIYDIAFLLMDLDYRARPDMGNIFLNEYLEQTGDYWGAVLLPFYCSLRAIVRAKVDSILSEEPTISDRERNEVISRVQRYHSVAESYAANRSGKLYITCGLSGSGKTTVARKIARHENAVLIRTDALRKHLAGIGLKNKAKDQFGTGIYTPQMTERTYNELAQLGIFLAANGWTVILDGTFSRREFRKQVIDNAVAQKLPVKILHCVADELTLRKRIAQRSGDISDFSVDLLDQQKQQWQPFTDHEKAFVEVIRTDSPSSV